MAPPKRHIISLEVELVNGPLTGPAAQIEAKLSQLFRFICDLEGLSQPTHTFCLLAGSCGVILSIDQHDNYMHVSRAAFQAMKMALGRSVKYLDYSRALQPA